MTHLDSEGVLAHYRGVAAAMVPHLRGRSVSAAGTHPPRGVLLPGVEELLEAVAEGARWFTLADGPLSAAARTIHLVPGEGADIATAATAALALLEQLALQDQRAVVLTDGAGGLHLTVVSSLTEPDLRQLASDLAARSPELATQDAAQDDGRVLLLAGVPAVPVPYSLVDSEHETGVVVPLTADEVAATTAGMPLDPEPADASRRLAALGDLAAVLAESA